jgi:hypothetical protein
MPIVHPSTHIFDAIERERAIIRRYQIQRTDELRYIYGFARVFRRMRIYFWARRQAIPDILAERQKVRPKINRHLV